MRKFFGAIVVILFMGSCSQPATINVQHISDTTTTEKRVIDIRFTKFTSDDAKLQEACSVVNDSIATRIDLLKSYITEQADEYIETMTKLGYQPVGPLELIVKDSVYVANDKMISARLMVYEFTGGAHGNVGYYAYNYDVASGKMLTTDQIINVEKAALVNEQLKLNIKNPEGCFNVDPTLADVSTINLTQTDFVFTFSPYTLGPWVCGTCEIVVPRSAISEAVLLKK